MSAGFSPDGTKLVSASDDRTLRLWDVATGECEQTLAGHSGAVWSAGFSPDGTKLVSASLDKTLRLWNVATGECEQTLAGHSSRVISAGFSPDGTKVVSAMWRFLRKKRHIATPHGRPIWGPHVGSPHGRATSAAQVPLAFFASERWSFQTLNALRAPRQAFSNLDTWSCLLSISAPRSVRGSGCIICM